MHALENVNNLPCARPMESEGAMRDRIEVEKKKAFARAFGDRMRTARTAAGMTQNALAVAVGATDASISNWENGKKVPTPDTIVAIADELGVTCDWLLTGRRAPPRPRTPGSQAPAFLAFEASPMGQTMTALERDELATLRILDGEESEALYQIILAGIRGAVTRSGE